MRLFELHRNGAAVAQGIEFDDETCVLRWLSETSSTGIYADMRALEAVHVQGHASTRLFIVGAPFERAMMDAQQDACENAPFACVGGLDKRGAMVAPDWIVERERGPYLEGYKTAAKLMYGDDWQTCAFGWAPALTIGGDKS